MIEQDARNEVLAVLSLAGIVSNDWLVDVFTVKMMKFYHQGGIDALDRTIKQTHKSMTPKGWFNRHKVERHDC